MSDPLSLDPTQIIGRTFADGRYRIVREIGSGAMGSVYEAVHEALGRKVAIKLLHPDMMQRPRYADRFRREARAASLLRHRNSVQLLDFGNDGPFFYLVMEFLTGRTLGDVLDAEGPLPVSRAIHIVAQVCAALGAAHDQSIVHRDIKPSNILLTPWIDDDGRQSELVKVLDFGIAKIQSSEDDDPVDRTLTLEGDVCGTPEYMSPEQAEGRKLDHRSDLYACGIVLFHILTGDVPFFGDTPLATMVKQVAEAPPPPSFSNPAISPQLEAIILRCLAKKRDDRFPTVRALRTALLRLAEAAPAPGIISEPDLAPVRGTATTATAPAAGLAPTTDERAIGVGPLGDESVSGATLTAAPTDPLTRTTQATPPPRRRPVWLIAAVAALLAGGASAAIVMATKGGGPEPVADAGVGGDGPSVTATAPPTKAPVTTVTAEDATSAAEVVAAAIVDEPDAGSTDAVASAEADAEALAEADAKLTDGEALAEADAELTDAEALAEADAELTGAEALAAADVAGDEPDAEQVAVVTDPREEPAAVAPRRPSRPRTARPVVPKDDTEPDPGPTEAVDGTEPAADARAEPKVAPDVIEAHAPPADTHTPPPEPHAPVVETHAPPADTHTPEPSDPPPAPEPVGMDCSVGLSGLEVSGSLPRSSVQRALSRSDDDVADCYRDAAKAAGHGLAGVLRVSLTIDVDGRARNVEVGHFGLPGVSRCVERAYARVRTLDRPDTGTVRASFHVRFKPRSL